MLYRNDLMRVSLRKARLSAAGLMLFSAVVVGPASAADVIPAIQPLTLESAARRAADQTSLNRWKLSVAPVFASQALDVASSYGMQELNPMLAGSDGGFGAKGAGIKLGATAGLLGVEYLIIRKYPRSAGVLTKINWSVSIVTTGFAAHNFSIR
jgi:hypothetical protein